MLHDGHIGSCVARQSPGIAVAAFVENSFSHAELIGRATLGSSAPLASKVYSPAAEVQLGTTTRERID